MNLPISFIFSGLPGGSGYCFTNAQRFAQDIAAGMSGSITGGLFNFGDEEPDPSERSKPWLRTIDGVPDSWYVYALGAWIWPHDSEAGGGERMWWASTESALWSYQGGDGTDPTTNPPTQTTGAMWQRDTDYDGKVALAAGTLPSGDVVAIGATGGEDKTEITLSLENLPSHTHRPLNGSGGNDTNPLGDNNGFSGMNSQSGFVSQANAERLLEPVGGDGDGEAVEIVKTNLPPYRAGFWAKRTSRIYKTPQ